MNAVQLLWCFCVWFCFDCSVTCSSIFSPIQFNVSTPETASSSQLHALRLCEFLVQIYAKVTGVIIATCIKTRCVLFSAAWAASKHAESEFPAFLLLKMVPVGMSGFLTDFITYSLPTVYILWRPSGPQVTFLDSLKKVTPICAFESFSK